KIFIWSVMLFTICNPFSFFQGVFSDIQLVESGPGLVRPESQLNLVCKVTGFSIATSSSYAWDWIRQPPGKGLEWLAAINVNNGGKWYGNSVKGRATISADQSRNEFSLQLNSVLAADSSVYFCAREYTLKQPLFGLCTKKEEICFQDVRIFNEILGDLNLVSDVVSSSQSFLFSQGVFSAVQLVESEPGIVRPGSQLNLLCKVTDFSIATSSQYAWHWIRQPNGKGLEWLSAINVNNGGKWYTNSVKSHATISADQSRNEFFLQLNSVIAEDSSVYFCFREHKVTYLLFVVWVFSDIQLVESGPGLVRPESQLNLVCKVTGFSIATSSSYAWDWIRQPPGKGLEWLAAINVNNGGKCIQQHDNRIEWDTVGWSGKGWNGTGEKRRGEERRGEEKRREEKRREEKRREEKRREEKRREEKRREEKRREEKRRERQQNQDRTGQDRIG
ncbi:hypothetical protein Chor_009620, partial [Crotalus horridus]